jgi:hypothetical protein
VCDQYLLGEHLLVAPILEPGCTARRVVLPEGRWMDLFDPTGSLTGPAEIEVEVGPDDIPVFVRAGAVLALLPEDVDSLSSYVADPRDHRDVLAFAGEPGERWTGSIGPELSCRTETTDGSWTLELSAPRPFGWDVSAWLPRAPSEVDMDGAWSFASGVLSCSLGGASARIRVRWV